MIKWDEPIQAMDGRHARVISRLTGFPDDSFTPTVVWIAGDTNALGFGDVFLVNNRGVRCDDRALFSMRQEPIIRNAPVKREGWVRVMSNNGLPYSPSDVVFSDKAAAEAACQRLGGVPAFVTWDA